MSPQWALPPRHEVELAPGGTVLVMTARSISVEQPQGANPVPQEDIDDETQPALSSSLEALQSTSAIVAELPAAALHGLPPSEQISLNVLDHIVWYKARLIDYEAGKTQVSITDVVASVDPAFSTDRVPPVFFRVGEVSFRLFTRSCDLNSSDAKLVASGGEVSQQGTTPHRRAKDKYTSAVAFEFVSNVINQVLGDEP